MGCLKLTYSLEETPTLRKVWNRNKSTFLKAGCLDYGWRFYDPAIARWHVIDPMIEKHYEYTPYAYVYNNPLSFTDPYGLDSTQRATAVAQAKKYVEKNTGDTYPTSTDIKAGKYHGKPGEKTDCAGMVGNCIVAGNEDNPRENGKSTGVKNILAQSDKIDLANAEVGNILTFNNSADGKDAKKDLGHTGIIVTLERNDNNEITNLKVIDSGGKAGSGKSGPRYTNVIKGGVKKYYGKRVTGTYKWDKTPDVSNSSKLLLNYTLTNNQQVVPTLN